MGGRKTTKSMESNRNNTHTETWKGFDKNVKLQLIALTSNYG